MNRKLIANLWDTLQALCIGYLLANIFDSDYIRGFIILVVFVGFIYNIIDFYKYASRLNREFNRDK